MKLHAHINLYVCLCICFSIKYALRWSYIFRIESHHTSHSWRELSTTSVKSAGARAAVGTSKVGRANS